MMALSGRSIIQESKKMQVKPTPWICGEELWLSRKVKCWSKKSEPQTLIHEGAVSCKTDAQRGVDKKTQALHSDILDEYSYLW